MIHRHLVLMLLALALHSAVHASPNTDALGRCLADNTTGKDRKDLAKWAFVAMSAHPEIEPIAKPSAESIEDAQRTVGTLVTRLISEACPTEMRAVVKADGSVGIRDAFDYLGAMAMQELMANREVSTAVRGFERYVDMGKVGPIIRSP